MRNNRVQHANRLERESTDAVANFTQSLTHTQSEAVLHAKSAAIPARGALRPEDLVQHLARRPLQR